MKSVLISIKPKYCELIGNGSKTIEVRKTRPKIETPFKCYIYCTHSGITAKERDRNIYTDFSGKVIGEFVCDEISRVFQCNSGWISENACISQSEFFDYLGIPVNTHFGYDKFAYGWHISDLVIYGKPKELSDFNKADIICHRGSQKENCVGCWDCQITRPPQSWCYVEGATNNE